MYIKFIIRTGLLVFALLSFAVLCACGKPDTTKKSALVISTKPHTSETQEDKASTVEEASSSALSNVDTYIILNNENTVIKGEGAVFENSVLTISKGGAYHLSGVLDNGKIYVDSSDEDKKVKLYLDGVSVYCGDDAPLFVENSPKETVIILTENSVNTLTDSADRQVPEDGSDYATATVYSKDDLQIEGAGTLNIQADFNKGIFSKNDVDIRGGNINITSADDGIRGKESVDISDGNITIVSGGDGIRTSETTETDKGDIEISGGTVNITSELDGIQAVRNLTVNGGEITVVAGGGADEPESDSPFGGMGGMMGAPGTQAPDRKGGPESENMAFGGFDKGERRPPDSSFEEESAEETPSAKGIKAVGTVTFSNATVSVDSNDDSIHADNIKIDSGSFSLKSTDDGLHADTNLKINGGVIDIPVCYEGIEGQVVDITDGTISLVSADDGFNAVSPDSDSSMGGPGMMQADSNCQINISGGYVRINAEGDGVDSNGNVNMTGGTLIVFGPLRGGNSALDYNGQFNVSGGTLLALGSAGMAQSVTGQNGVKVFAYNYSQTAHTLCAVTDKDGKVLIGFKSPKDFQTMVLASDKFDTNGEYTLYQGGSIDSRANEGVYFEGEYTDGVPVGVLS